jgi:hypothetical protein
VPRTTILSPAEAVTGCNQPPVLLSHKKTQEKTTHAMFFHPRMYTFPHKGVSLHVSSTAIERRKAMLQDKYMVRPQLIHFRHNGPLSVLNLLLPASCTSFLFS